MLPTPDTAGYRAQQGGGGRKARPGSAASHGYGFGRAHAGLEAGAQVGHGLVCRGWVAHRKSGHYISATLTIEGVGLNAVLLGGK